MSITREEEKSIVPDRDEARTTYAQLLLERIRQDSHPSATQMTILEQTMPQEMVGDYVDVLLEKVFADESPSITMLRRLERMTRRM